MCLLRQPFLCVTKGALNCRRPKLLVSSYSRWVCPAATVTREVWLIAVEALARLGQLNRSAFGVNDQATVCKLEEGSNKLAIVADVIEDGCVATWPDILQRECCRSWIGQPFLPVRL